jgi:dTDP-4-dehydrorhamnose reductase
LENRILITGGSGNLGKKIIDSNLFKNIYYPTSRQINILNVKKLKKFIKKKKINLIIHCAALARMRECEKNVKKAIKINIEGTLNIINVINSLQARKKIKLIYISSDAVYPGIKGNYSETHSLMPFNVYGWSKLASEFIVKTLDKFLIIRTRFFIKNKILFKYSATNIYTSTIEIDKLVLIIYKLVNKNICGIINVGEKKISDYKNYKKFKKEIKPCSKNKILKEINFKIATNASLNISLLNKILCQR